MSARLYSQADWLAARRRRAQQGKAPRLAVQRSICLRQSPQGNWAVAIYERRYGVWRKPEWLCSPTTLKEARKAALRAWRQYRLPLLWSYSADPGVRAFHFGVSEPQAVRA